MISSKPGYTLLNNCILHCSQMSSVYGILIKRKVMILENDMLFHFGSCFCFEI